MKIQFDILRKSRQLVLKLITGLTLEQIHTIPDGFKNNIAWNVVHLVVTQQLLQYKLSGLDCLVPDELIEEDRKGTAPTKTGTEEEVEEGHRGRGGQCRASQRNRVSVGIGKDHRPLGAH